MDFSLFFFFLYKIGLSFFLSSENMEVTKICPVERSVQEK
jgi:hypothetical protein